jgi:hypothetical protein
MGPLIPLGYINPAWNHVIAFFIGVAFGAILESSGFSSSRKIVGVFYGYDMTVLRVFMTAVVVAMVGIVLLDKLGWLDMEHVFILPTFLYSSIVGGFIMGLGFLMGGYCPGTSFCGIAIGKIDAMMFTLGMFLGIFVFSEAFPLFEKLYNAKPMGPVLVPQILGISRELFVLLFVIMALGAFVMVYYVTRNIKPIDTD